MDTKAVATKLVELCKQGKFLDAVNTLYSNDIVSVEPMGNAQMPAEMRGIDKVRGKNQWWMDNHEMHHAEVFGPFIHGDRFIVGFHIDVSAKAGPKAGKRMTLSETALYLVKDGKVAREEFFMHANMCPGEGQ